MTSPTHTMRVHGVELVLVGIATLALFDKFMAPKEGRWFAGKGCAPMIVPPLPGLSRRTTHRSRRRTPHAVPQCCTPLTHTSIAPVSRTRPPTHSPAPRVRPRPLRLAHPTVHAFANLLVVLTALPGVYYTFTDPLNAMDSAVYMEGANWDFFAPASIWPIVLIMSVHIYHMVAFKDLTSSDYFHHRALCVVLYK